MGLTLDKIKNIKKWVKALRSGKYKQSRGAFKGKRGFCCLGVAGELGHGHTESGVCESLGIKRYEDDLVGLNDRSHRSFSYIADWIENNILGKGKKEDNKNG